MNRRHRRARRGKARLWLGLVAIQALVCLGSGLASVLLPDDPSLPSGYYDGDDDDAAATPEPIDGAVALIIDTTGIGLPVQAQALLGLAAAAVGPPRPGQTQAPLLRSPPV